MQTALTVASGLMLLAAVVGAVAAPHALPVAVAALFLAAAFAAAALLWR